MSQPQSPHPIIQPTTDQPILPQRKDTATVFAERCGIFARSILEELPELESVLIVPGWLRVDETGLPSGVVMGRAGPLQHIQETAHLLTQTVRAVNALADNMDQHLEGFEQQSNALAARLSLQMQKLGPGPGKE